MDDDFEPTFVHNTQGPRSAFTSSVNVSHDLGDRTLVMVILLTLVIGACGWEIGQHRAVAELQGQYMRDVAVKLQVNTNHVDELDKNVNALKEAQHANQR